ncbi:MAG TPA: carboxymuconolactone decarboxylase family protein [Bacteroidia bacterium]|nr:carboxymuconolactone decarboxylase family protein [Bacteroidia bacterium]
MTFIKTNIPQAGIVELLFYKGPTGSALSNLAQTILRGPSSLTPGEREMIAGYVSYLNACEFCHLSHTAAMQELTGDDGKIMSCVRENIDTAPVSEKMKALLRIAGKVQKSGKEVTQDLVDAAKKAGATDEELHDAVLVAAAFCMYNRYVDGLRTTLPENKDDYIDSGKRLAKKGYKYPPRFLLWMVRRILRKDPPKLKERPENNPF